MCSTSAYRVPKKKITEHILCPVCEEAVCKHTELTVRSHQDDMIEKLRAKNITLETWLNVAKQKIRRLQKEVDKLREYKNRNGD